MCLDFVTCLSQGQSSVVAMIIWQVYMLDKIMFLSLTDEEWVGVKGKKSELADIATFN